MLKFLKTFRILFWGIIFVSVASLPVMVAVIKHTTLPSWKQITDAANVSNKLPRDSVATIEKSRRSAVMVRSVGINVFSGISTTSGTYFTAKDKNYVVTVEHGVHGPCWLITVIHENNMYSCKKMVIKDPQNDYAIFEVEEISNIEAIKIPQDLPRGHQWKRSYSLLNKIIYTGYPNAIGPLTFRGDVIGYTQYEQIYVFSHAYGGASGSGVFSEDGKYIGYIIAIDIGQTEFGVDVLENIVIVNTSFNIDWRVVLD